VPFINPSRIPRALSIYYGVAVTITRRLQPSGVAMPTRQGKRLASVFSLVLLTVFPANAAERDVKIQRAIDRGVRYLKGLQGQDGEWTYSAAQEGKANVGATALAALALIESGVKADHPSVRKAADYVRRARRLWTTPIHCQPQSGSWTV
jgi:hypothetical protein